MFHRFLQLAKKAAFLRALAIAALTLAACACGGSGRVIHVSVQANPSASWEYVVELEESLATLDATVCFSGRPPPLLVAGSRRIARSVLRVEDRTPGHGGRALAVRGSEIDLSPLGDDGCVGYVVDLRSASRTSGHGALDRNGAVVLSAASWLLRPSPRVAGARGTIRFRASGDVRISVPWTAQGEGYRLDEGAFRFLAYTAFGRLETFDVSVPGGTLEVARIPGELDLGRAELARYLSACGAAAAGMYGRFPVERAQVIVVPVGSGSGGMAFGQVGRGGGASILLLMHSNATLDDLAADWVTVHEFSHLTMPVVARDDAWLSEGTATYYQEVLRARAGLQTPLEAWRAIDDGFRRGEAGGTGRSLAEESRDVHQTYAFTRVYWAGTAIALLADVELRRRAGPVASLDAAMERLASCCAGSTRTWSAAAIARTIDGLAGADVLGQLMTRHLPSTEIPDVTEVYRVLGLARGADGLLVFDDEAPGASIRDAIMAPVQTPASKVSPGLPRGRAGGAWGGPRRW